MEVLTASETLDLFRATGVMTETEVRARQEVELETYVLNLQIEGRVLGELVYNYVIPATIGYQNDLLRNIAGLREVYGAAHKKMGEAQLGILEQLAEHLQALRKKTDAMTEARKHANSLKDIHKKARAYCDAVLPYFEEATATRTLQATTRL